MNETMIQKIDKKIEETKKWNYKNKDLIISLLIKKQDSILFGETKKKIDIFYNIFYNEIYYLIKKHNFKKENIYIFENYYIFNIVDKKIKNIFIYKLWKTPNLQLKEIIKWLKI